ncbi:MAG: hypothetical protein AAGI49_10225 [Bacteroidota bacterium]
MKQLGIIALLLTTYSLATFAQCVTWNDLPNKAEVEENHVLYRDRYKEARNADGTFNVEKVQAAMPYWEKVYAAAPAADGKRDLHFSNGIDMLLELFKVEADATKKEALKTRILKMYDDWVACVEAGTITLNNTDMKKHVGFIRGREAFNMYYTLNVPYEDNIAMLDEAIEVAGNDTEYIILRPYANIVQYEFTNELMEKEKAREVYKVLNDIADYNIKNNKEFGSTFKTEKDAVNQVFSSIENYIFDCDYFKAKLVPDFKADPDNGAQTETIIKTLLQRGCDKEDPVILEMQEKYAVYADSVNAVRLAEFYANNPGAHARDLYKEGKYDEAIAKWEEATKAAEEDEKKSEYSYWIAYTRFHKLNTTSGVLSGARKGTEVDAVKGNAYILIGDYYAKVGRSCNDAWQQRLAILGALAKYATAKSVDPDVSEEANRKIGIYAGSKPERQEGFMRKVSEGQRVKAKCIGEMVTVSFVD